jgi:hypothetical protein
MDQTAQNSHISNEHLSLFIDGRLDDSQTEARITRHLDECDDCRERAEELRTVSVLLARLPEPALPRSFRLSEADLPRPVAPVISGPWFVRFQPAIRSAAAIAAVLLLAVIGASLVLDSTTERDEVVTMMEAPSEARTADEDAAAPSDDAAEDAEVGAAEAPELESDSPEPEAFSQAAPADAPSAEVSALSVVAVALAIVTVALLIAGFVLPRWWTRSRHGRA